MTPLEFFLRREKLFNAFIRYIRISHQYYLSKYGDSVVGFSCAFDWSLTEEGNDFWSTVSAKYDRFFKKYIEYKNK